MFYAYGFDKGDKLNRLTKWRRIEKQKGRIDWLHECPDLPDEINYIWRRYGEVKRGVERLSYQNLHSYCWVNGEDFEPWEIDLLFELEQCQMTSQNLD